MKSWVRGEISSKTYIFPPHKHADKETTGEKGFYPHAIRALICQRQGSYICLDGCKYLKMYREFSWIRQWQPTPVLLPGNSHGRRSVVGCSLWGHEESDTTERLHFNFLLSCIGEGNGNPLQCSCLENPRDSGAWWAAVCGVAQSRTWLKWLSSSREFS